VRVVENLAGHLVRVARRGRGIENLGEQVLAVARGGGLEPLRVLDRGRELGRIPRLAGERGLFRRGEDEVRVGETLREVLVCRIAREVVHNPGHQRAPKCVPNAELFTAWNTAWGSF